VKDVVKAILPHATRRWLRRQPRNILSFFSWDFDLLRRTTPIDRNWGGKRGQIVDRYYIENFLSGHSDDFHGHVLEFGDDNYSKQFGGSKVSRVDVMHLTPDNPHATIIADLSNCDEIPSDTFDCIVCTQVLLLVFDLRNAIRALYRILKPGGVLLLTAPGIQKISRGDMEASGEYWRFTTLSMKRLFEEMFPRHGIEVTASGNVLAATAFLLGLSVEDLHRKDLQYSDPDFQVSIALRAVKPLDPPRTDT
jgi:SAM-dependent methyltransferase